MEGAAAGKEKDKEDKPEMAKLEQASSSSSSTVVAIAKKLGLRSVLRDQWKKEKRKKLVAAREAALTNEQAMLEARMGVEELPSWVFFPDKERAEWVNTMLKQLWPFVNEYVRDLLFKTIEPLVEDTLKEYKLNPFKFTRDRVFLGQVPPRITGIKMHSQNVSRKEMIMDMDIVFASNLVVEFKVKGIPAKISDFGLRGMLRVVFKPLVSQIPLVGGIQAYFLKAPEIDYELGGVGDVLNLPGLHKIVEQIIAEQVKNFIVLPNKFSMPLISDIHTKTLKCPDSAGVLRVKLIRAKDLANKDGLGSGVSDPYAILTVGAATAPRTPTIRDNVNPVWNMHFDFPIEVVDGQELFIEFYDDDNKDDEFLGRAKIQTSLVAMRGHIESHWVNLVDADQGSVQVSLSWLPVTDDKEEVKRCARHAREEDVDAKGLIHIYVDSCKNLSDPSDPSYNASPMIELFNGRDTRKTFTKYYTNDPVIEQGFVLLSRNPYTDEIRVKVIDKNKKEGSKKEVIGTTSINVWSLIEQPNMEYRLQPFILKIIKGLAPPTRSGASPEKPLDRSPKAATPGLGAVEVPTGLNSLAFDDDVKSGRIKIILHRAENLKKMDLNGKADPYVVVTYENQRYETKVCKKTLEPIWEHELYINTGTENQIKMEIFDKDKIGKDETMGWTTVDVRRISRQGRLSEEWDNLIGAKEGGRLSWSMTFFPADSAPTSPPKVVSDPEPYKPTPSPYKEEAPVKKSADPEPYEPTPSPYKEEAPVKRSSDPKPNTPTPSPYEEEAPVKKSPDGNIWDEAETEGEPLIRVKRDPKDLDEPLPVEETGSPPVKLSTPAPVDNLGYMGPVLPGFLKVTVHRAEDLMDKDFAGKSDPYVVIKYAGQKNKSKKVESNLNPEFEFTTGYVTEEGGPSELVIELWDHDVGKDESLGHVVFDIRSLHSGEEIQQQWYSLNDAKRGSVQVSMEFSPSGYNDGPTPEEEIQPWTPPQPVGEPATEPPLDELRRRVVPAGHGKLRLNLLYDDNRQELKVFVHEAAGLPGGDLPDPPDPQVKVYLMPGKKKKKKTEVVKDCVDPKYNEEFDFDIDFDKLPQHSLKFSVVDRKGVFSKSPVLGTTTISLDNFGLRNGIADWFLLEADDEDSE